MKRTAYQLLIFVSLLVLGSIMIFPFLWMILSSIKTPDEIISIPITWLPGHPQWENYSKIWSLIPLGRMYVNSIIATCTVTACILFTSSMSGYALAKFNFRGRDTLFFVILSTMMIPFFVLLIPLFFIVNMFGWLDSYIGLIAPNAVTAFGIYLVRQFSLGIPSEIMQAARIDGASEWKIYYRIIAPLQATTLAALGIFAFVYQWDSFLWPLVIINERSMSTLPLGLNMLRNAYSSQANMNMLMTGSTLAVIPSLIVFVSLQRYFVQGITMTGIKG
jgi:multiple sugar transport system permease protein